jgi:hypothetical protein
LLKVSDKPMFCQTFKPLLAAALGVVPGAVVKAMLPLALLPGVLEVAGAISDPLGMVIMPVFIDAVAVAMVCSLYFYQTGMFKMSS